MVSTPKSNRLSVFFCILLSGCLFLLLLVSCNKKEITEKGPNTASSNTNSQAQQFELDIKHYINSYNNAHWDEVVETMYPPMYNGKTKNDLMTDFVKSSLMGLDRQTNFKKIEKITPVVNTNGNLYAKIYFGADVQMNLSDEALKKKDFIKYNLELSYDTQDVLYDETKKAFTIKDAYCTMLAISKKGSNIWKYIEVDQQKAPYLSQVIPQEVLNTLNNY